MKSPSELDHKWQRNFEVSRRRLEWKERAIKLLGGKCTICGYDRCPAAMDFHHSDPSMKDLNISSASSWKMIEKELPRCTLLCSNCHREVHAGWHPRHIEDNPGGWDIL